LRGRLAADFYGWIRMVHSAGFRVRMPPLFATDPIPRARASERLNSVQVAEVAEVSPKSAGLGNRVRPICGYSRFPTGLYPEDPSF